MIHRSASTITILEKNTSECPYITGRLFTASHFFYRQYDETELEELLNRGYRHFTYYFFRPECEDCGECIPLRIMVNSFISGKTWKRIIKRNQDLVMRDNNGPTEEHFRLYCKHKNRFAKNEETDYESFKENFFSENPCTRAYDYFLNKQLVCCSHYDLTVDSVSAIYTYYDTDFEKRSLGVLAVLNLLRMAEKCGKKYLYLGYYVENNCHMNYKRKFYASQIATSPCLWHDYINDKKELLYKNKAEFSVRE